MRALVECLEALLPLDVKPATGCTEPAAAALCAAYAAAAFEGEPARVRVAVSGNVLKNALEVGLPGTRGERGLPLAVALGAAIADPADGLQILRRTDSGRLAAARRLLPRVEVTQAPTAELVHIEVTLSRGPAFATAVISGDHDRLVRLATDGGVKIERPAGSRGDPAAPLRETLCRHTFREIFRAVESLDEETLDFMIQGVEMNEAVARAGLEAPVGMGVGYHYRALVEDLVLGADALTEAKMLTAAAVDARMYGLELPVMTSCGSGNQGIVATVPLRVLARRRGHGVRALARAVAIAHAANAFVKHHTGKLSAMCGCVAAGVGTALGAGYLLGAECGDLAGLVNNMAGSVAGVICDGAKVGCSLKLALGVEAAFTSAFLVQRGIRIPPTNGICGERPEETLRNLARVASPGMVPTDAEILAIMLERNAAAERPPRPSKEIP